MPTSETNSFHRAISAAMNLAELCGRIGRRRLEPRGQEAFFHLRPADGALHLGIQLGDDVGRCAGPCDEAAPAGHVEGRIAGFDHRRQVRQEERSLRRAHGQPAQSAGLDLRLGVGGDAEKHLRHVADRRHHAGIDVFVRHVDDIGTGHFVEIFAGDMRNGADASRGAIELAWILFDVGHEFRHRFRRHAGIDDQRVRDQAGHRDRRKLLQQVIGRHLHGGVERIGRRGEQ